MAAGDIIIPNNTITPEIMQKLSQEVAKLIQSTAKDPAQYEEVTSLAGVSSIPVFQVSGSVYKLVRVAINILKGVDGKQISLQVTPDEQWLQWRYTDAHWQNLFDLSKLKGPKGDPFLYSDFTPEQLESLKGPAGKTAQFKAGTASTGATPSITVSPSGNDLSGNPVYTIDIVTTKGDPGKAPVIHTGTIQTGNAGSSVQLSFTKIGDSPDGSPIYEVSGSIPRGEQGLPGTGSGNVSVSESGLSTAKKYLFQPSRDNSSVGNFVEYTESVYSHPTHVAHSLDLYKVQVDDLGHVVSATKVTKSDITSLGIPEKDTVYTHPTHTAAALGMYQIQVDTNGHVIKTKAVTKEDLVALGMATSENASSTKAGLMTSDQFNRLSHALVTTEVNTLTTLTSLPIDKYSVKVTLSSASALSFASTPHEGWECMIDIKNTGSAIITQALPNSAGWQCDNTSIKIAAGKIASISVRYVHGTYVVLSKGN